MIYNNKNIIRESIDRFTTNNIIQGSAVVIFCTADSFVVASDSKAVYGDDSDTGNKICKIFYFSDVNVGFAAAGTIINKQTGFNLHSLAKKVCYKNNPIDEKTEYFIEIALPEFIKSLENMKSVIKALNIDFRTKNIQICFFGFDKDIPHFCMIKIIPKKDYFYSKQYDIKITKTDISRLSDTRVLFLGDSDEMYNALKTTKIKLPYTNSAKRLIEVAIQHNPTLVGPPINILVVKKQKVYWHKKSFCNQP